MSNEQLELKPVDFATYESPTLFPFDKTSVVDEDGYDKNASIFVVRETSLYDNDDNYDNMDGSHTDKLASPKVEHTLLTCLQPNSFEKCWQLN